MNTTDSHRQGSSIDWNGECSAIQYTRLSGCTRPIQVLIPDNPNPTNEIRESEVVPWLTKIPPPPSDPNHVAGLRLIALTNTPGSSNFPLKRETLTDLVREWGFPTMQLPLVSILIGGCSDFVIESRDGTKISMFKGFLKLPLSLQHKTGNKHDDLL